MLIEIKGVQFVNKGAGLMLRAVVDRLRAMVPGVEFALTPGPNAPFHRIVELGAWQRLRLPGAPIDTDALSYRLPQRVRRVLRRYGMVTEADVDAVLDASGFAYGDAWGDAPLQSTAREIERLADHGKPYVFLPQAFGPFADTPAARQFGRALPKAAMVFARDQASLQHLVGLCGQHPRALKQCPDFTIGLRGDVVAAERHGINDKSALLIPSARMEGPLNADSAWRVGYLPLMVALARRLSERGFTPRILNHAGREDDAVCNALREAIGAPTVIDESDPVAVKGVIGAAAITVCSRYHGCISAMSQGVPCVGTAWSHKYAAMFEDFGMKAYLLTRCDEAIGLQTMEQLLSVLDVTRARLIVNRRVLEAQVDAMWHDVLPALRQ